MTKHCFAKRYALFCLAGVAVLLAGGISLAIAAANARLFVVNTLSSNLSVIDLATDTVVDAIPLGEYGYRIAFAPDKRQAYVTTYPGTPLTQTPSAVASQPKLLVVDLPGRRVSDRIPLDIAPLAGVHAHPDGRRVYVVTAGMPGQRNTTRGRVLCVDLAERKVTAILNIGLNPLDSAMTPDGKKLYTADWSSRSISVVDLTSNRLVDTIPLGTATSRALTMRSDGTKVYAIQERLSGMPTEQISASTIMQNSTFNTTPSLAVDGPALDEIDTRTNVLTRYPLDGMNAVIALAIAPDGSRLYVYGRVPSPPSQSDVRGTQRSEKQTRSQSVTPLTIADAYDLQVVDLKTHRVTGHFGAFGYLSSLAVAPDGGKLYLVGTPGDPEREADIRQKNAPQLRNINAANTMQRTGAITQNNTSQSQTPVSDIHGLLDDLRQLPKTVIILDARTGRRVKTLSIGSMPQASGLLLEQ